MEKSHLKGRMVIIQNWKSLSGEGLESSLFKLEMLRKTEQDFIIHVRTELIG